MQKLLFLFILVLPLQCKTTAESSKMNQTEDHVIIAKGELYGAGAEGIGKENLIITSQEEWQQCMDKMNAVNKVSDGFSTTDIDFSTHRILAVFDELKSTGGHTIDIDLSETDENIIAKITSHSPEGMATSVMTQPFCIVKIANTSLPVVFK